MAGRFLTHDTLRTRDRGQGLPEFLGLALILATSLAVGVSLLPASDIPALARNGFRDAVCKTQQAAACDREDVSTTSNDDEGGNGDDGDSTQADDDQGDEGEGGDDGGALDGVGDFFSGAGDVISDGAGALWDGTKQVGGFFKGIGEQAWDTGKGLWDTVTNPGETWEGIKQLWNDPGGSLRAIWDETTKPIVDDWNNGNYGEAIGRGVFSIAEVVFGGKGLSKLGKASKLKKVPDKDKDKPGEDKPGEDKPDEPEDKPDEPAVCPRSWQGGRADGAYVDLYAAPKGPCKPDAGRRAELNRQIDDARNSTDPAKRDEGDAAHAIRENVWDFDRKVGPNGSTGQVDIETEKAIIEVTRGRADGKYKQTTDTLRKPEVNPEGKPVILYIKPGKKKPPSQRIKDLEAAGVRVVRNDDELKQALRELGEDVP